VLFYTGVVLDQNRLLIYFSNAKAKVMLMLYSPRILLCLLQFLIRIYANREHKAYYMVRTS